MLSCTRYFLTVSRNGSDFYFFQENQTTSNGYSPSSLTRKWQNSLPVITEPSKEEFSPERDVSEAKQTPSKEEDNKEEKKEDNSTDSSPSSWRRSFHEELEGIKESPPLKPLPSYLRVLTYSDDDLAKEDNKSPDDKHEWSRSTTLSIRSYDTDSPSESTYMEICLFHS